MVECFVFLRPLGLRLEFSSSGKVEGSTFTAGTLNMVLSGDGNTTGKWVSPTNWAPGQEVTSTIHITNTGSIDAHHIYFGFSDVTNGGPTGSGNLLDKIIVTNLSENFNGHVTANQAANIDQQIGNKDGVLTLNELTSFMKNGYGYYTSDDQSGDGIVLQAGDQKDYSISMTFQFDPNAGNEYQGTTAGFTFMANATQNSPTDGLVALHPQQ